MKAHFAPTRSFYRRITPVKSAEAIYLVGNSARLKILRAVQLHDSPPPTSDTTDSFIPLFNFLSEYVEDHWHVQEQWSSCKWAANDESLAAATMLYYGWAPTHNMQRADQCCIFQLRRADDGVHLTLSEPHTFNDRLTAACARALSVAEAFKARNKHAPFTLLFQEAARVFFSFNHYYVCMTPDYRQAVMNKLRAYCERLTNALNQDIPPLPSIEQPENLREVEYTKYGDPVEYIMKWEDFILEDGTSSVQKAHLSSIATTKNRNAVVDKWFAVGLAADGEYTDVELNKYFTSNSLAKARSDKNQTPTLIWSGRKEGRKKFWKLNPEVLENERS